MRQEPSGEPVWQYGLLPAGRLGDYEDWHYRFAVDAYAHNGLRALAKILGQIAPDDARRFARETAAFREKIGRAVFRSMAAAPVARLRDGAWIRVIPPRTHLRGRDYGWIPNILCGAHSLIDGEVIEPDEPAATCILKDLEDNLFMSPASYFTAEHDWFSRGGIALKPNLVNTPVTYLLRDELPRVLRPFYNTFAVSYYPDVHTFTEWTPSFGTGGGPAYKASDEAAFLTWLRLFLLREAGDVLHIATGAPRRRFRQGERMELHGAATFFGQAAFPIQSKVHEGFIEAAITLAPGSRARRLALRLRHPDGRPMARAEGKGRPWTDFDAQSERVFLPAKAGQTRVRVWY
ncbi:MAG: hypothetical protein NZ554_07460 [Bryobacteraceae bacterium]|nr:hypothetical protein [Bryobacteraceae bacterium]